MNDILITNGTIIDGTGKKPYTGSVLVKGGTIAAVGKDVMGDARRTIDATGLAITPGFIDITNHSDTHWTLFSSPRQESMLRQGITTIFGGSCGSSLAPLVKSEDIRAIQKWSDVSEINLNWLTLAEFLSELDRHKLGVNFGTLVGHGTLRRDILTDQTRPATTEEINKMMYLLAAALREGAFGISYGLTFSHGKAANEEELTTLAKTVQGLGRVATIHVRDEGKNLLPSITEALRIARTSGIRLQIAHIKALGRESWDDLAQAAEMIQKSRAEDIPVSANVFPYTKTGSLLYALLPPWARDGGKEAMLRRITEPNEHRKVIESLENATLHYDRITIASAKKDKHSVGRTIKDISADWGMMPEEALLDILRINDMSVTIFGATVNEEHISLLYKEPFVYFSSDGVGMDASGGTEERDLAHPRSFGAAARFLGEYVRMRHILSWEEAVHKMTAGPASFIGLPDRGALKAGAAADIVVFDQETIADNATYENPFQYPAGIPWVIVNGMVAVDNGTGTEAAHGNVLRAS